MKSENGLNMSQVMGHVMNILGEKVWRSIWWQMQANWTSSRSGRSGSK